MGENFEAIMLSYGLRAYRADRKKRSGNRHPPYRKAIFMGGCRYYSDVSE